ncbi:MAG: right-handed parallel beta-helix repeat-containing protein [Ignavibacteriae bacterium]|nr:right-handed parallel beta-helix repeat-containing protein [Ignavibacteriota bacterium]
MNTELVKKRSYFLLIVVYLSTLSAIFSQTNYYVSSTLGSDSNDGTSESNAWKTTAPFNNKSFNEGDIINFQKDGVWEDGSFLFLDSGITIKSYGNGNNKPVISNLKTLDLCWTMHSQSNGITIWKAITNNFISRLIVDGNEYLKSTLFNDLGANSIGLNNSETQQKWFFDSNYNILFLVSDTDPNTLAIESSTRYYTIIGTETDNVIIKDIEVRGGFGPSIWLRDSDNLKIENCIIGKYSETGILVYGNSYNCQIQNNIIDSGWDSSLVYGTNNVDEKVSSKRGVGDGINFVGGVHNSFINNNIIRNWGHTGIEFLGIDYSLNGVNNNHISSNLISTNMSYGRAIGIDGILDKCKSNVFRYNSIENCTAPIQFNGNNNTFHHNIVRNTLNSPCKPSSFVGKGIELSIYGHDFVCQSIRIDNNIFINNDSYGIAINNYYNGINNSLGVEHKVSNIYIRNNVLVDNNLDNNSVNESLFVKNFSSILDVRIQNNLIYDVLNPNDSDLIDYRGSLVDVETGIPVGSDTLENNIHENPDFSNLSNYTTNNNSPCINSGINVEYEPYATDFDGDSFPYNNIPDIGIQENQEISSAKTNQKPKTTKSTELQNELGYNLDDSIKIYPNPLTEILNINSKSEIISIKLIDVNGKSVHLNYLNKNNLDISTLSSGIYILKIRTLEQTYLKKVIKK